MATTEWLLPEVARFLAQDPIPMYIGGKWINAAGGRTFDVLDPGDGKRLARVSEGGAAEIDLAVLAARKAFETTDWATQPVETRARILYRLAELIEAHLPALAQLESLDAGKPRGAPESFDIPDIAATLRWYADLALKTPLRHAFEVADHEAYQARVPRGVAGIIVPWNYPFVTLGWNIAPALAAGNTIVAKPAEDTPLTALYLCLLAEEAGIPPGVLNIVTGFGETAGAALSRHPGIDRMSFTGSPEVGRLVGEACGRNLVPVTLELGGKGAAVVFEDVDRPEDVGRQLAEAVSANTGQLCCTATRWIIHQSVWDDVIDSAIARLKQLRIGHGYEPGTEMGPAISAKQRDRIIGYLNKGERAGAKALLAGGRAEVAGYLGGFYVKPAVLRVNEDNPCWTDEIFGPVAAVHPFTTEAEAIALVNNSRYGLANSVWTGDLDRAHRVANKMVAGNSWINRHNVFPIGIPYAGCKVSGCGGSVRGADTLYEYLRPQSIVRPLVATS